jgi:hypothetical protein
MTNWERRVIPSATWARTPQSVLGFVTRADGFEELRGGHLDAKGFSLRDDGFLSLDMDIQLPPTYLISLRQDDFVEIL